MDSAGEPHEGRFLAAVARLFELFTDDASFWNAGLFRGLFEPIGKLVGESDRHCLTHMAKL